MKLEINNLTRICFLTVHYEQKEELIKLITEMKYRYEVILENKIDFTIKTKRLYVTNLRVLKKHLAPKEIKKPLERKKTAINKKIITGFNGCLATGHQLEYIYKLK